MSYDHVYNFKRKHLSEPPFGIPREEIFASEEQKKKINLKRHHMLYQGIQEVAIQKDSYKLDRSYYPPVSQEKITDSHFWIFLGI